MATIETKYSIGDVVWFAGTTTERKQHPCPDCKGERKWKATSPAGEEYSFTCPRCSASFLSNSDLSLNYTAHVAHVTRLTIGSIQYNSNTGSYDAGARYMCHETGVGSGQVYDEARLFSHEESALLASELLANEANATTEWIVKLHDQALKISDYELGSASLKLASEAKSRASSMLWNLSDLFEKIEEAEGKDEILEAVESYKKWDWDRDKEKAPQADVDGALIAEAING